LECYGHLGCETLAHGVDYLLPMIGFARAFFNSKYGYDILRNLVAARYTYTLALIFGETIVFQRPQDVEINEAPV